MLNFISILADFKAARAALAAGDFAKVVATAADLLDVFGMKSFAAHVRGELAAVGAGDARGIAENALGLVADLVNAAFSFGQPITVNALPPGGTGDSVIVRCDAAIGHCKTAATFKATAVVPGGAKAISLDQIIGLIALALEIGQKFWGALRPRPAA